MRKYELWLAVAGVCLVAASAYYFHDSEQKAIEPTAYSDGSIEYTLVHRKIYNFENNKYYDHYWNLRFPNLIKCNDEKNNIKCSDYKFIRNKPKFDKNKNDSIFYHLKLNELKFSDSSTIVSPNDVLTVLLSNTVNPFFEKTPQGDPSGFALSHRQRYEIKCRKNKEIAARLFELRNMTSEEKTEFVKNNPGASHLECAGPSSKSKTYALYDRDGKPRGGGFCLMKTGASCTFTVWLPQEREAVLRFPTLYLKNFPNIYDEFVRRINAISTTKKM